jgi:hypothetical protein
MRDASQVVAWFGAMQAQEYGPAKWALGLRLGTAASDGAIERACNDSTILRTHVLRPTWHFVTPSDIRWMLALTAPHLHRAMASYRQRLELDDRTLVRALSIIECALATKAHTRAELRAQLAQRRLPLTASQMGHLMLYAELEQVACSGPRTGKHFTYALLADRARNAKTLSRDEAIAELTRRFLQSHAPATIRDFVWWSGLKTSDAKRGVEMVKARPSMRDGLTYWSLRPMLSVAPPVKSVRLLPIYDEYLVAYRDRLAVPHGPGTIARAAGQSVAFQHAVVIDGQVAGTWRVEPGASEMAVRITALRRLQTLERRAIDAQIRQYRAFLAGA